MDEYNLCTLKDAPMLAKKLIHGKNIYFGFIDEESESTYSILIALDFAIVGTPPYGGIPFKRFMVGITYQGLAHFSFQNGEIFPSYVEEKLRLPPTDAAAITRMLNAIREELEREL